MWVKMRRTRIEPMSSAYHPIATGERTSRIGRFVPRPGRKADSSIAAKEAIRSPVGAGEEGGRNVEPERLRGIKVDDQFELNGLFDWKTRRLRAAQNPINITGSASEQVGNICPISSGPRSDVFPKRVNRRQSTAEGKCIDQKSDSR